MGVKFSELTAAGALTGAEIAALSQDVAATLTSVQTTLDAIGVFFAGDTDFGTNIVNNNTFVTEIINELTTNNTFITDLTSNATFVTEVTTIIGSEIQDTDDVPEGTTNLYFTEARIRTEVTAQASASYNLVLTDADSKWINCTNAGATTVTIPQQSSVAWPANAYIEIHQGGAGAVTIQAGTGVTLRVNSNLTAVTNGQYAVAAIKRLAENEWVVFGNLVPA